MVSADGSADPRRGGLEHDLRQAVGKTRNHVARIGERARDDARARAPGVVGVERRSAGQADVEHGTHRVDVRAVVDLGSARGLLGRPELRCGELGDTVVAGDEQPGCNEVEDLDERALARRLGHVEVLRLEVAVHETSTMRHGKRRERLADELDGLRGREATPAADAGGEGVAVEQLHDEERPAVVGPVRVEDVDDAGMPERGRRTQVGEGGVDPLGIRGDVRVEDLDRARTVEGPVARLDDLARRTPSEEADDAEPAAQPLPGAFHGHLPWSRSTVFPIVRVPRPPNRSTGERARDSPP